MLYRLLASGAFVCALTLLSYASQGDATTRPMLNGASSLTILAADEENAEVRTYSSLKWTKVRPWVPTLPPSRRPRPRAKR